MSVTLWQSEILPGLCGVERLLMGETCLCSDMTLVYHGHADARHMELSKQIFDDTFQARIEWTVRSGKVKRYLLRLGCPHTRSAPEQEYADCPLWYVASHGRSVAASSTCPVCFDHTGSRKVGHLDCFYDVDNDCERVLSSNPLRRAKD